LVFGRCGGNALRAILIIFHQLLLHLKVFEKCISKVTGFELNFLHFPHKIVSLICATVYHGVTGIFNGNKQAAAKDHVYIPPDCLAKRFLNRTGKDEDA
jgi:hypothetical protein